MAFYTLMNLEVGFSTRHKLDRNRTTWAIHIFLCFFIFPHDRCYNTLPSNKHINKHEAIYLKFMSFLNFFSNV